MATEIGSAYLRILPTMKGFGSQAKKELDGELVPAAEQSGKKAGEKSAGGFKSGFSSVMKSAGGALAMIGGVNLLASAFQDVVQKASIPAMMRQQFALTADEAQAGAKVASEIYSDAWGASLKEVAQGAGQVQRALRELGTGEDLKKVTVQATALSEVFGEDLRDVVVAATQLVRTGLSPTMESAFDVIVRGFQSGVDQGRDLLDTLIEYPVQFQALGLSASDALKLMESGLKSGARNSDLAADALKEFALKVVDGSKATAEGFKGLGLDAETMAKRFATGGETAKQAFIQVFTALLSVKDPLKQTTIATQLLGTKSEDLKNALFSMNPAAVLAGDSLAGVSGAAQALANDMGSGLNSSITTLTRSLQEGLINGLTAILPVLVLFLEALKPFLPVLIPLVTILGLVTAAVWAFNAALAANPIVFILSLIAALVAGFIHLWNTSESFRGFWVGLWEAVKRSVSTAVHNVQTFWNDLKNAWNQTTAHIRAGVNNVIEFFRGMPAAIGAAIKSLVGIITKPFRDGFNAIAGIWNSTVGRISFKIPDWVPGIGGKGFSVPKIPTFAEGGIVGAQPGGMLAIVGEGGQDEAIVPLNRLPAMLADAAAINGSLGSGETKIVIDGTGLPRALSEWLRYAVRTQGRGGSVQMAFGRGAGV